MPGMTEQENRMGTDNKHTARFSERNTSVSNGHTVTATRMNVTMENEDRRWTANKKAAQVAGSNLTRSGSVKDLIYKFSGPSSEGLNTLLMSGVKGQEQKEGTKSRETSRRESEDCKKNQHSEESEIRMQDEGSSKTSEQNIEEKSKHIKDEKISQDKSPDRTGALVPDPHSNYNGDKRSGDEPTTPKIRSNPKYELFLGSNGTSGANGSVGGESAPANSGANSNLARMNPMIRGSMDSLSSRDWDSMSDRTGGLESPPRVFNSPYATLSLDYNPPNRMSDFRNTQEGMSPGVSEVNLFRNASPVHSPVMPRRSRIANYESLSRRREVQPPPGQFVLRNNQPNKRDFIQELTRQLEECQRRNQFLEAESIEMDKERNQIRFEMRGLLVNNEDLLRTNTQMQGEMNRMREKIVELESNNNVMIERFKQMENELKEAREVMVEANTQEYAFNFLQQSLKNRIDDTEEALKKQTEHSQLVSEKLWLAERNLEELELEKENKTKKVLELSSDVSRLETELADALQESNQARTELSLQQKLRADATMRVEELEESILEKDQELLRLTQIVNRLQGEVTYKLSDKEQTLEEEIQLRERAQLQCKQAERTVEDLRMEMQTLTQSKDELAKQLKLAQEKIIDLESDLEEMHENEQRSLSKHKRALEQAEQLQMKLIQEKDVNDQLECEKVILERQLRDLRIQMEELQNNRVEVDSITRAESKAKELENMLRTEERNKMLLTNTISKLERKIQELTEQMEEDIKMSTEQKELMTQRIRSLKRQLNEAEEETSRRDVQYRHTQRELSDERETNSRLQRQLLDQHLQMKRNESRQTLEKLKLLDLSVDEEDEQNEAEATEKQITQV